MTDTITLPRATVQQALEALESGLAFPTHSDVLQNLRTALAEPEQSFEDEQRVINADNHRRANALEEAIHAAWSAGYVEGEKAVLEQQAEPVGWPMEEQPDGTMTPVDPAEMAPPQRKPLTDEQVHAIWDHKYRGWFSRSQIEDITRAIEAAHCIKEGT